MSIGNHSLPSELMSSCGDGTLYCFGKWAFDVTQGMFWTLALLGFSIAVALASMRLGTNRAFGYASFVGMIGSIWFAVLGFMSWWISSIFIIVGAIGIAVMVMNER